MIEIWSHKVIIPQTYLLKLSSQTLLQPTSTTPTCQTPAYWLLLLQNLDTCNDES